MDVQGPQLHLQKAWFPYAAGLGVLFIIGFNLVGITVEKFGISLATLMQKMSIVISVFFSILFFSENVGLIKILGLLLAFISILMYNNKVYKLRAELGLVFMIPILAWITSGLIEIGLLIAQRTGKIAGEDSSFVSYIFLFAGIFGLIGLLISKSRWSLLRRENLIAGLALGVPNFFSMYYLVKLLNLDWDGSVILPVNNIGILVCSAILGLAFFKEKNNSLQWLGLILSIVAIFVLSWSQ